MEVMNENHIPEDRSQRQYVERRSNYGGYIFLGIMLVVGGFMWLLYNFDVVGERTADILLSWQMVMIIIGGFLLFSRNYVAGSIVGGLGLLFMVIKFFGSIYLTKVGLPLALVVLGIVLIISKLNKK